VLRNNVAAFYWSCRPARRPPRHEPEV